MSRSTGVVGTVVRGLLMGGADIIPGVSGGTVALILGIYERLVTALSHFDVLLVRHLAARRWGDAARHIDLRFLVTLGTGIGIGIALLASVMHDLLEHHLEHTLAAFFGLILASSLLVARMVDRWRPAAVAAVLAAAFTAFWLVGLAFLERPPDSLPYLFLCGAVAICAMILPGISGAFILVILGKYYEITGVLKELLGGSLTIDGILKVLVFSAGAALGLISFSKILRWLLARFQRVTMAALTGFMVGSLRRVWPFKIDTTPEQSDFKHKVFENAGFDPSRASAWGTVLIAVAAAGLVFTLDHLARRSSATAPLSAGE